MDLLKMFKAEQDEERRNLGSKWVETDRLFVKWNGEPQHPNTTYTWFLRFCERNNFRFCDIHSMRHRNNMKTPLFQTALLKQTSPCKAFTPPNIGGVIFAVIDFGKMTL